MRLALTLSAAIIALSAVGASAQQNDDRVVIRHVAHGAGGGDTNEDGWLSRDEASAAVEGAMQLLQQAVLAFMVGGGITSGKEAWPAIKGVDLNAGIIAQGPFTAVPRHHLCLETGIFGVAQTRFLDLETARQRQNLDPSKLEHPRQLSQLLGISAGDHQRRCSKPLGHAASPQGAIVPDGDPEPGMPAWPPGQGRTKQSQTETDAMAEA